MPNKCIDFSIPGRGNDFHACRIQIRWRDSTDNIRVGIYLPQEPNNNNDSGAVYFQEHFAANINTILSDISEAFGTTIQQVNAWSSLQREGTKRFSVEIACTPNEVSLIRNGHWEQVASVNNAVSSLEAIAIRY